ncbi:response regulator transcription factor [Clostridium sediminicola]|uniref:LytR/AlgR family response regulator transcription factor n=1 Tax=Clostridium sediminicola TaxID=3114879 RepID=UPI0031F23BCE
MISVVLVDDERPSLEELEYIISKSSFAKIVGKFTNSIEAIEFVKIEEPDLVFLDINMPELGGMEFAEEIIKLNLKTDIIFATAYDKYAMSAFDKDAVDYILKPYEDDRVFRALRKVKSRNKNFVKRQINVSGEKLNKIPIWKGEKIIFVNVEDILYCKVEEREVSIHTLKEKYFFNDTLSKLEEKLPKETFFRTHRSYLVNLSKILEVSPYFNHTLVIKLEGSNEEIPVSRSNIKAFKEKLKI